MEERPGIAPSGTLGDTTVPKPCSTRARGNGVLMQLLCASQGSADMGGGGGLMLSPRVLTYVPTASECCCAFRPSRAMQKETIKFDI